MISRIDKETTEQHEPSKEEDKQQDYIAFLESEVKRLTEYSNKLMRDRVKMVNILESLG